MQSHCIVEKGVEITGYEGSIFTRRGMVETRGGLSSLPLRGSHHWCTATRLLVKAMAVLTAGAVAFKFSCSHAENHKLLPWRVLVSCFCLIAQDGIPNMSSCQQLVRVFLLLGLISLASSFLVTPNARSIGQSRWAASSRLKAVQDVNSAEAFDGVSCDYRVVDVA